MCSIDCANPKDLQISAVILNGGRGTRSKNPSLAKALQIIGGKPIIEWQIEALRASGVNRFIISLGNLADQVLNWSNNFNWDPSEVVFVIDDELKGTANALAQVRALIQSEYVIVCMGDVMFYQNLRVEISQISSGHSVYPITHPNDHPKSSDKVFLDYQGEIVFFPKNQDGFKTEFFRNLCLAGITLLKTDYLMNHSFTDTNFEKSIIPDAISQNLLMPLASFNYFKDSGTNHSLEAIERDCGQGFFELDSIECYLVDLDDTLVIDSLQDKKNSHVNFYTDALSFIKRANDNNVKLIVVTNQPALAKGQLTQFELNKYISDCEGFLSERNLFWDSFLYCPHHPEKGHLGEEKELKIDCSCRKPDIGLIQKVLQLYGKSLKILGMIGDSNRDLGFASKLGVPFIHINRAGECDLLASNHSCVASLENVGAKN
jgi:mannose-1-phosphate guanylyltransferase/phosphomannomutase